MMKKHYWVVMVVVAFCLAIFTVENIVPALPVDAASVGRLEKISEIIIEDKAIPLSSSDEPVVFVVTGLVCLLFGTITVAPLLESDPA